MASPTFTGLDATVERLHGRVGALSERVTRTEERVSTHNGEIDDLKIKMQESFAELRDEIRKMRGPSPWWPVVAVVVAVASVLASVLVNVLK